MTRPDSIAAELTSNAPALLRYLVRRVGVDDAADLLGETMVVAWRRAREFPQQPERARMWLFGIARGVLQNHARGERRRWALADRLRGELRPAEYPSADAGDEVRDAVERLDADLAEIVQLVHWEHLTLAEASEVLGIPASTARGRYQRAREQLRSSLNDTITQDERRVKATSSTEPRACP
ncbi:sigma-70 family RNA polymerase sigma factor [Cryobacterium sp. TMT2-15-1]|nr:sigma-70 family RNA polymerase sigma factor [Cryobacterium sp. TMT2-15-1]